jgi:phosphate transport system permease protein
MSEVLTAETRVPEPVPPAVAPRVPQTTVPDRLGGPSGQQPRSLGGAAGGGARNVIGAAVAAVASSMLLFGRLAPLSGLIGFVVVTYVIFIVAYAVLVSLRDDAQVVRDRVITVLLYSSALLLLLALVSIILFILWRGHTAILFHKNFFTQDLSRAGSLAPLTTGGIKHAFVGTLWMITIALIITVPLGLLTAVYLNEVGGRLARFVRTIVEAMTALPSIIAGLFIFATWILILGKEKSALAAALALSVDMLPIIIRAADVVLRLVPGNLREASGALGASRVRTVWHVVLPTARSGLATAVILGMARGLGETAPVLLVAGYTAALNTDPVHGPMVSLPLVAIELVRTGIPTMQARGFAAAAFLLLLVIVLFAIARFLGGRGPGRLSKRQARRAERVSIRDANRIIQRHEREGDASRGKADRTMVA